MSKAVWGLGRKSNANYVIFKEAACIWVILKIVFANHGPSVLLGQLLLTAILFYFNGEKCPILVMLSENTCWEWHQGGCWNSEAPVGGRLPPSGRSCALQGTRGKGCSFNYRSASPAAQSLLSWPPGTPPGKRKSPSFHDFPQTDSISRLTGTQQLWH